MTICSFCQSVNRGQAKFCRSCGEPIACLTCGQDIQTKSNFCDNCGSALKEIATQTKPSNPLPNTMPSPKGILSCKHPTCKQQRRLGRGVSYCEEHGNIEHQKKRKQTADLLRKVKKVNIVEPLYCCDTLHTFLKSDSWIRAEQNNTNEYEMSTDELNKTFRQYQESHQHGRTMTFDVLQYRPDLFIVDSLSSKDVSQEKNSIGPKMDQTG